MWQRTGERDLTVFSISDDLNPVNTSIITLYTLSLTASLAPIGGLSSASLHATGKSICGECI